MKKTTKILPIALVLIFSLSIGAGAFVYWLNNMATAKFASGHFAIGKSESQESDLYFVSGGPERIGTFGQEMDFTAGECIVPVLSNEFIAEDGTVMDSNGQTAFCSPEFTLFSVSNDVTHDVSVHLKIDNRKAAQITRAQVSYCVWKDGGVVKTDRQEVFFSNLETSSPVYIGDIDKDTSVTFKVQLWTTLWEIDWYEENYASSQEIGNFGVSMIASAEPADGSVADAESIKSVTLNAVAVEETLTDTITIPESQPVETKKIPEAIEVPETMLPVSESGN